MRNPWIEFDEDKLRNNLQAWVEESEKSVGWTSQNAKERAFQAVEKFHEVIVEQELSVADVQFLFPTTKDFVTEELIYSTLPDEDLKEARTLYGVDTSLEAEMLMEREADVRDYSRAEMLSFFDEPTSEVLAGLDNGCWVGQHLDHSRMNPMVSDGPKSMKATNPQRAPWFDFDEREFSKGLEVFVIKVTKEPERKKFLDILKSLREFFLKDSFGGSSSRQASIYQVWEVLPSAVPYVERAFVPNNKKFSVAQNDIPRIEQDANYQPGDILNRFDPSTREAFQELDHRHHVLSWEQARPLEPGQKHPWLASVGIEGTHGLRVDASGDLLIPACDRSGKLQSLQCIAAPPLHKIVDTPFHKQDGPEHASGLSYRLNGSSQSNTVILARSFREGATLNELTKHTVLVCFDDFNMPKVAEQLAEQRKMQPDLQCFVAREWNKGDAPKWDKKAAEILKAPLLDPHAVKTDQTWGRFWEIRLDHGKNKCLKAFKEAGLEPAQERSRLQSMFRAVG